MNKLGRISISLLSLASILGAAIACGSGEKKRTQSFDFDTRQQDQPESVQLLKKNVEAESEAWSKKINNCVRLMESVDLHKVRPIRDLTMDNTDPSSAYNSEQRGVELLMVSSSMGLPPLANPQIGQTSAPIVDLHDFFPRGTQPGKTGDFQTAWENITSANKSNRMFDLERSGTHDYILIEKLSRIAPASATTLASYVINEHMNFPRYTNPPKTKAEKEEATIVHRSMVTNIRMIAVVMFYEANSKAPGSVFNENTFALLEAYAKSPRRVKGPSGTEESLASVNYRKFLQMYGESIRTYHCDRRGSNLLKGCMPGAGGLLWLDDTVYNTLKLGGYGEERAKDITGQLAKGSCVAGEF